MLGDGYFPGDLNRATARLFVIVWKFRGDSRREAREGGRLRRATGKRHLERLDRSEIRREPRMARIRIVIVQIERCLPRVEEARDLFGTVIS